jgi:dTMP kinase
MSPRGRFIVLEGGEGVGKTTQAERLAVRLGARLTREPGGTVLGEATRTLLLDPRLDSVAPRAELLLMVAARAQHVAEVILPALESGRDVVCDRFSGSTLAYQGFGRGLPLAEVRLACELATSGLEPDRTILIDIDPGLAATRPRADRPDRIEAAGADFHERVRRGFLELAAGPGWVVVDGAAPPDEVAAAIDAAIDALAAPTATPAGRAGAAPT